MKHCLLFMLLTILVRPALADEPTLPAKENFHIYLLTGQSNMAGRGKPEDEDKRPHPRVLVLTKDGEWVPAVDPLHSDKPTAGVGPGKQFGIEMAEADPNITIGLVPTAVGGTPLSRWVKGADLHENAIVRAEQAAEVGMIKGVIWLQGSADSKKAETAATYAERLDLMIADMRDELGQPEMPFIAGELSTLVDRERFPFADGVRDALHGLPDRVPHTDIVSTEGMTDIGDHLHFDSKSARELGRRYAKAMQRLSKPAALPPGQ